MAEKEGKGKEKSEIAKREEEVLAFWKANRIFEKSLEKPSPNGEFVFYDGPPFATGLPHYGSLLSSIIKDVIPRYKTMRGFYVRRRWGWDCHGLPIENLIEKKLGLKTKKDIEVLGIDRFNEAARAAVLEYADEWERYIDRIGRWVDFKDSYKTMDNAYIESVWWALAELHKKGLLYEGRKVLLYCPHCETPLSKAEIAMDNSYQDVTEEAVTVKFKLKALNEKLKETIQNANLLTGNLNVYMLAWTTTPWTFPGNVALAVGNDINYVAVEILPMEESGSFGTVTYPEGIYILAENQYPEIVEKRFGGIVLGKLKGSHLVGLEYEPLFNIPKVRESGNRAYYVTDADFVNTEDGTGIVHTAVIYGEDDYKLGLEKELPMVPLLDASGRYNDDAPEFLRGLPVVVRENNTFRKPADEAVKADLEGHRLLFEKKLNTHSYPHCYRCGTPLLYNALSSWFVNIQNVKQRMVALNEEVNWVPEHLKHGRFGNTVATAPDWNISRNRFWASPLPIWKSAAGEVRVIGSIDELKRHAKKSGNSYTVMRHGEAEYNTKNILNADPAVVNGLTEKGREQAQQAAEMLKNTGIDYIVHSPLQRTRETAAIVADVLGLDTEHVVADERLQEVNFGEFEGKTLDDYHGYFSTPEEWLYKEPQGGENWLAVKRRMGACLYNLEKRYAGKRILILSHRGPIETLFVAAEAMEPRTAVEAIDDERFAMKNAETRELPFVPLPHNAEYELDLHRPYIDTIELVDENGVPLVRIPEVVDCWVESGSMPFAEYHYPTENTDAFAKRSPGDFIAEYIAQTRTWFYYMHAISSALFDRVAFRNVVTTGTILAADGTKMSKSKGNYTDPLHNLDMFGADALRFYLMSSVVMQAEDLNFRDEELREAANRVLNMLWNSYKFYELYRGETAGTPEKPDTNHVLDRWIFTRLSEMVETATAEMDRFDTVRTARAMRTFIGDLSTWYIRRSRERLRLGEAEDRAQGVATLRFVLATLAKIMAPITPFIAEEMYRGVGGSKESVHLADWPEVWPRTAADEELVRDMETVRRFVSLGLEARASAGIKIRQPLQSVTLQRINSKLQSDLLDLIKDEVNVKNVIFDDKATEPIVLDTIITPELKHEGQVRELIRAVQDVRKQSGLAPGQPGILSVAASEHGRIFMGQAEQLLKRQAYIDRVLFDDTTHGTEVLFEEFSLILHISPC